MARCCEALDIAELIKHPDYATGGSRTKNRKVVNELLGKVTKTNTSAHWIAALNKAGVPCGPINTIDKTFDEPQVKHLGIARAVKHPKLGAIRVVGQPINLSAAPQPKKLKPTPELGQHTDIVLKGLGLKSKKIKMLRGQGVI